MRVQFFRSFIRDARRRSHRRCRLQCAGGAAQTQRRRQSAPARYTAAAAALHKAKSGSLRAAPMSPPHAWRRHALKQSRARRAEGASRYARFTRYATRRLQARLAPAQPR